jgi:hypothetical protein
VWPLVDMTSAVKDHLRDSGLGVHGFASGAVQGMEGAGASKFDG